MARFYFYIFEFLIFCTFFNNFFVFQHFMNFFKYYESRGYWLHQYLFSFKIWTISAVAIAVLKNMSKSGKKFWNLN